MMSRNGVSMATSRAHFTQKSPIAQVSMGKGSPKKAIVQKIAVSRIDAEIDAKKGACHQAACRKRLKTVMSSNCEIRKAEPEAKAILGVASQKENITAKAKPT